MLATYVVVFILGCGVGAVASDLARRRQQRLLMHKLLQALESGELRQNPGHEPAGPLDKRAKDPN